MPDGPRRPFFGPLIGITLLFAVLGPPVGGAVFAPLALFFKAPAAAGTYALGAVIAAFFGHGIMFFFAYLVGLAPAAATGLLYGLWDAAAPAPWPRALVAAIIGGLVTYAVALRLAALGVDINWMFEPGRAPPSVQWISDTVPAPDGDGATIGLIRPFVASGAVAGLVCAFAASLMGVTLRPRPAENRERL